jgi:hypothetical protein
MKGTFTAKLATVKEDGSSHVVPIWFVLEKKSRDKVEKLLFLQLVAHQSKQTIFKEIIE